MSEKRVGGFGAVSEQSVRAAASLGGRARSPQCTPHTQESKLPGQDVQLLCANIFLIQSHGVSLCKPQCKCTQVLIF